MFTGAKECVFRYYQPKYIVMLHNFNFVDIKTCVNCMMGLNNSEKEHMFSQNKLNCTCFISVLNKCYDYR